MYIELIKRTFRFLVLIIRESWRLCVPSKIPKFPLFSKTIKNLAFKNLFNPSEKL